MKYFSTVYMVGRVAYSSFIYAPDRKTAEFYVLLRNIGEKITGVLMNRSKSFEPSPLPSHFYQARELVECVHCLTFYSWISSKCRLYSYANDEILRDDGILHEIVHELHHPEDFIFRPIVHSRLSNFETLIPGLKSFNRQLYDLIELKK